MSTDNKSNKYITEELLDESLKKKLRFSADKVSWDDLNSEVASAIKSGTVAPGTYNDEELRNRIVELEEKSIVKGATINQVDTTLLDSDLTYAYNEALKVENKADKDSLKLYREKSVPIYEADVDPGLQDKLNTMASGVANIQGDFKYNATMVDDIANLKNSVASLTNDKLNVDTANTSFRKKDIQISLADVDTSISVPISKISTMAGLSNEYITEDDLENYRKKTDAIGEDDLDQTLLKTIKDAKAATEGTAAQIVNVYNEEIQAVERGWVNTVYGQLNAPSTTENPSAEYKLKYITPYSLQHNAVNYCGTLATTGDYSMASTISWLYEAVMHGSSSWYDAGTTKTIYGLDAIKSKIDSLNNSISSLNSSISSLQSSVKSIETRLTALESNKDNTTT